jgi:O-antigen/teichoic acid export membrane protein
LKLPLPVLLFGFLGGYGIFAGTGTATLLTVMLSLFVFMPQIYSGYCPKPGLAHNLIRRVLPFSLSNYLANILSSAPTYIFPLLVLNVLGPEENAFFYMAWVIAMVLTVIPSSFAQSLFAEGSHDPGKLGSHGRRALLLSLLLLLPAILVMIVLGRWILHWFGAAYAENGIGVFRYLVWSMLPACLNSFFITVNQVKKRVALIILQTGFVSFASLGLGYWLLKTVGLSGLGMAYAIANTALALVIAWPLWNEFRTGVTQAGGLG